MDTKARTDPGRDLTAPQKIGSLFLMLGLFAAAYAALFSGLLETAIYAAPLVLAATALVVGAGWLLGLLATAAERWIVWALTKVD